MTVKSGNLELGGRIFNLRLVCLQKFGQPQRVRVRGTIPMLMDMARSGGLVREFTAPLAVRVQFRSVGVSRRSRRVGNFMRQKQDIPSRDAAEVQHDERRAEKPV